MIAGGLFAYWSALLVIPQEGGNPDGVVSVGG